MDREQDGNGPPDQAGQAASPGGEFPDAVDGRVEASHFVMVLDGGPGSDSCECCVPMHRSSQERPFRISVAIGRIRCAAPQATVQVTRTAHLAQCFERVEAWDLDGCRC